MLPYLLLTIITILFFIACIYLLQAGKEKATMVLLFAGSLGLRLYMALQDAFLHDWDEKFHALVARSLMNDPLQPLLRANPIGAYNKFEWCCNHVWLHKQPLFMWQMALSMKLFGISEFSIRYPSVLMGALMPLMVYGVAKAILQNKQTALVTALLMCVCNFHLELISGYNGTDHNDVAFGFYVLASFWAYTRYTANKGVGFALLIGLLAGCAIMNKWLTGAVVYAGWGLNILLAIMAKDTRKELVHMAMSLLVCAAVFVPWQLYILHTFPAEANYEYAYNSRHITEVIEDHKGSMLFYIARLPYYYGAVACALLPVGFWVLVKRWRAQQYKLQALTAMLAIFVLVFVFFSVVVTTKWVPYVFVVTPLGFVMVAAALQEIRNRSIKKQTLYITVVGVTAFLTLNPMALYNHHNPTNIIRSNKIYNTAIYKAVNKELPDNVKLVLNTNSFEDIDLMFYHNDLNVYSWTLNDALIDSLKRNNLPFAVFTGHGAYGVPKSIEGYKGAYVIDKVLR